MARIKPPFAYFGSKGRFYKEIKEIFEKNYRANFIDLFAGAMEIPLSFKNEFDNLKVLANVKDEKIECFLKENALEVYKKGLGYIKHDLRENARDIYSNNKDKFEEENRIFKNIFSECCPCCGKRLKNKKNHEIFNDNEKMVLKILMGFGGCSTSLSNSFYSSQKLETLEIYLKSLKTIEITNNLFDENMEFKDSFIFLDPPYIQKINKEEEQFIGYNYASDKGIHWSVKDDNRLIEFIKRNQNKNNVFLVFGSVNNNLSRLLKNNFECEFIVKEYKRVTFGKLAEKAEYFCLIK